MEKVMDRHFDAVIIGAGPAGLAAGIELAQSDWKVLIIEKSPFPRHKVCGGFVGPENKSLLKRFGILDQMMAQGAAKVRHIHLSAPNGKDVKVPLRLNGQDDFGLGFSRYQMDDLLLKRAKRCGVSFMDHALVVNSKTEENAHRLTVKNIKTNSTHEIQTRFRINAAGAKKCQKSSTRVFGVSAVFDRCEELGSDVTMHFVPQGHLGINRFEDGKINACYVVKEQLFKRCQSRYDKVWLMFLDENPWVNRQLKYAKQLAPWKGTYVDLNQPFRFYENNEFYVGDAAGIIHPVAGGGISIALNSGLLLGQLLGEMNAEFVDPNTVAAIYASIFKKNYYWPVTISKYIGQLGHNPHCANAIIQLLRWREKNIHQLFDVFHKPAVLNQRITRYETC